MKNLCLFLALACLTAIPAFAEEELRKWTDLQGRKIEARMTGFADGFVGLKLKDGRDMQFPFNKLSENDRGYVRENAPVDPATAAYEIDKLVWARLKEANADIKVQRAAIMAKKDIDSATRNKALAKLAHMEKMTHPTKPLSDEAFLRRVYLDIAGRIPTYEEADKFLRTPSKTKRAELIDELIDSEAFVSHFFNYMSDLLRIRDGISMGGFNNMKSGAYVDWVKDQIREDRPWNEMVSDMLTAKGYLWENPATGYLLTDFGMELCNLSNTFTTFAGTEITCAQCHDHPFEDVYQMDFFKMASFFGQLKYDARPDPELMKTLAAKKKEYAAAAKKAEKNANDLNNFLNAYNMNLGDGDQNKIKLPFDYKYDDGDPNQPITNPQTYFGEMVKVEKFDGPREAFADWLTSEKNPRFTINIVNRLWKHVFGIAQIEPVDNIPGHLDGQAQNYELLKFLESLMKEVDYSMKDFLRVMYKTQRYQSEACYASPTLEMIDKGEFHFAAPVLRRMSAEQLWDSLVAMSVPDPEGEQRLTRILDEYRELMDVDWKTMTYSDAEALRARYNAMGKPSVMMSNNKKKNAGPTMIRASEMRLPSGVGSFLYAFGQSDKKFIENSNTDGTIPQVMMLLNGSLTNQIMTSKDKTLVRLAQAEDSHDDGIDIVFLSILSRRPHPQDRDYAEKLVRGGQGASADYSDLIWALLNTREFMFIQ
ncbi:MAG: DUF1549 domain-containing protein [Verrucomicrobiales bacterium]|nr:DUF1549 domain-containing protein [Verrucomicrobiales bacterium]